MNKITESIRRINEMVTDARFGLQDDLFFLVSRLTPMVNVDLLIKNDKDEILLTWREDKYYGPGWHLPGGIIRFKELWENRVHAVATHELGARISISSQPIAINQLIASQRDERGHFISLLFECKLISSLDEGRCSVTSQKIKDGDWRWHKTYPQNMIPQHKIYEYLFAT